MATSSGSHIDCSICLENMADKTPRALRCLHSFCERCLIGLLNSDERCANVAKITCPTCRNVTRIPNGEVVQLPLNFYITNLASEAEKAAKMHTACGICKPEEGETAQTAASYKCGECDLNLCSVCAIYHVEGEDNHRVKLLNPLSKLCQKHQRPISISCVDCDKEVCTACMHQNHKSHKTVTVDTKLKNRCQSFKKSILTNKKKLALKLSEHQFSRDSIKKAMSKVEFDYNALSEKLEEQKQDHLEFLKAHTKVIDKRCTKICTKEEELDGIQSKIDWVIKDVLEAVIIPTDFYSRYQEVHKAIKSQGNIDAILNQPVKEYQFVLDSGEFPQFGKVEESCCKKQSISGQKMKTNTHGVHRHSEYQKPTNAISRPQSQTLGSVDNQQSTSRGSHLTNLIERRVDEEEEHLETEDETQSEDLSSSLETFWQSEHEMDVGSESEEEYSQN